MRLWATKPTVASIVSRPGNTSDYTETSEPASLPFNVQTKLQDAIERLARIQRGMLESDLCEFCSTWGNLQSKAVVSGMQSYDSPEHMQMSTLSAV